MGSSIGLLLTGFFLFVYGLWCMLYPAVLQDQVIRGHKRLTKSRIILLRKYGEMKIKNTTGKFARIQLRLAGAFSLVIGLLMIASSLSKFQW